MEYPHAATAIEIVLSTRCAPAYRLEAYGSTSALDSRDTVIDIGGIPCKAEWNQNKAFVTYHPPMNTPYCNNNNNFVAVTTSNH
ncbi:uncharacterized protein EAF01_001709 [Botrytis porri]|uniref:uncharacterized protein n=1 Tax=Botrytis porri TaxID=87229 RepID=UPI0018FF61EE|nr:uncharacterized protein EAF01_001709 [Botrytis porri]KAF7912688.1 hypothetical protein EAF01_001709 [Botrytis porri]